MSQKPNSHRNGRTVLVRFVLPRMNPDTGVKDGVFEAAYALRRAGTLKPDEQNRLDRLLNWFGDELAVPRRFNRTRSKGYFRRRTKGICWFKSTAIEHVSRMHRIAAILRRHGHHVAMIRTRRPGYVVYEDKYQVVAKPFADLRG